jgi:branched-chain amino acid transport system substrate-binding protein
VPQLFVASGSWKWGRPEEFPWTMGYQPDYFTEGLLYAKHILANIRDARVGILMQNDDFGQGLCRGLQGRGSARQRRGHRRSSPPTR